MSSLSLRAQSATPTPSIWVDLEVGKVPLELADADDQVRGQFHLAQEVVVGQSATGAGRPGVVLDRAMAEARA